MLKSYLTIAFRSLWRARSYTALNVLGLAVGMACCLLILIYVYNELSYDRQHEKADRIYRLTQLFTSSGNHWACIGPPVGPAIKRAIPEIEKVTRFKFFEGQYPILGHGDRQFEEKDILYADSTVFQVFTLPLIQGNPANALSESGSLVLTNRMAKKYFGDDNPMGETLLMNGELPLRITGVMEDLDSGTHIPFDFLLSMSTFYANAGDWVDQAKTWAGFHTYLLLGESFEADRVETKFPTFVSSFFEDQFDDPPEQRMQLHLQPLRDIHLKSRLEKEIRANGDMAYIYIFSAIAVFILLIACVNFINLAVAQYSKRLREVGMRKVLGAKPGQLANQFLLESCVMTVFSLLISLILVESFAPILQNMTDKDLSLAGANPTLMILGAAVMVLFTALFSGGYPAFVFSKFRPIRALQGLVSHTAQATLLRKGLVVFQFTISIFLIIGALTIHSQLDYFFNKKLGFEQESVVVVPLRGEARDAVLGSIASFKQSLLQHPGILRVAAGSEVPGERFSLEGITRGDRKDQPGKPMRILWGVDEDYLTTLGVNLVLGRNFSSRFASDSMAFILNESGVRELELEDPIGTILRWGGYVGPVVGVTENFHFASLHHEIEPLIIPHRPSQVNQLLIRVRSDGMSSAISAIQEEIGRRAPGQLFVYSFLNDDFASLYNGEEKLSDIFIYFTGIAILVACLGLFGLTRFATEQRTKEIGMRKVLGAPLTGLVNLLCRDFLKLVLFANIIAWPVAYYVMNSWLQNFAYRVEIGWWMFALAGCVAFLIALVTVSSQAIRKALANPVDALRYE